MRSPVVVGVPSVAVATAEAYRMVRPNDEGRPDLRAVVATNDLERWRAGLVNDFEAPVLAAFPAILRVREALYDEVRAFRAACGDAHLKTILATGELGTLRNVARASRVAMMAGADFIKTSTGKEKVNATLPVSLVMVRAIREYRERTGYRVGFKPAGGISTARQATDWLALMKEELGNAWMRKELFRLGASSLLADLERQLEHHATGRYSANFRHPVG